MLRYLLLPFFVTALFCNAQMVQKCCGTNNSTFLLGNTSSARHTQCIYLPGELQNAVAGPITKLYYRYGTTGIAADQTLTEFRVGFVQNNATSFTNSMFFTNVTPAKNSAVFTIPAGETGEWFVIELDQPFQFDPAFSLIVDISFATSTVNNWGTMATTSPGRKLYFSDPTSPTGQSLVETLQDVGFDVGVSTNVPRMEPMITSIWPNPATEHLFLQLDPMHGSAMVEVFDASGSTVLARRRVTSPGDHALDVSSLHAGIYLLRITADNGHTESVRFGR